MSTADSSSVTSSFDDISVCEEIGQLIERCEDLHQYIHNSFETLQNIHSLVESHNNINVTYNEWTGDFEQLLEVFHEESLKNINEGRPSEFGLKLLKMLNEAIFD
jgi:uncharacterized SAM-dependent methyltransferase